MGKFEVGEIAEIIQWDEKPDWAGRDCMIIGISIPKTLLEIVMARKFGNGYYVDVQGIGDTYNGKNLVAFEQSLRKKKPPKEEEEKSEPVVLGRWQDIEEWTGWHPGKVTTNDKA